MAKKEAQILTACYRQLHLNCVKATNAFQQSHSKEDLHQLRVAIKKLDALFYAANKCSKGFKRHKLFASYRSLFKQAGVIRDAQVQVGMLSKMNLPQPEPVSMHLQQVITEELVKFSAAAEKNLQRLQKAALELPSRFNTLKIQDLRSLLEACIKKEEKRWKEVPAKKALHAARKPIKRLLYLQEFLTGAGEKRLLAGSQAQHWDNLQKTLGDYHDLQVLQQLLRSSNYKATRQLLVDQSKQLHKKISKQAAKARG